MGLKTSTLQRPRALTSDAPVRRPGGNKGTRPAAVPSADALGHPLGELTCWQGGTELPPPDAMPRGYGNVVPAYLRETWDEAAFVRAYDDCCAAMDLPGFDGGEGRLDYLARFTYPTSGCPTLASFARQRVECDLFHG